MGATLSKFQGWNFVLQTRSIDLHFKSSSGSIHILTLSFGFRSGLYHQMSSGSKQSMQDARGLYNNIL